MLLKDCPVGSFVRLVSFKGADVSSMTWWDGAFDVKEHKGFGKYVIDGHGDVRDRIAANSEYQFQIVAYPKELDSSMTLTLNGKTYKLKPHTEPRLTVIDGVTYEMELV